MKNATNIRKRFINSKAYKYANYCAEGNHDEIGKYVELQAKAWIDIADGKDKEAYVDLNMFNKICKLLKIMNLPDDPTKTIYETLSSYSWFFVIAVMCTKCRNNKKVRYYESALLEISRKNYKTFTSAIVFIIGMLIEPRFSRFFSVAPDFKLSNELRLAVKKIISCSPALAKRFKTCRDYIHCKLTDIDYTPLAYSGDAMDGKMANIFLADEAGLLDDYPVEAMRSSQITLLNKLGIIISTQYPNDNNVFITEIDYLKKVLCGLTEDKRYFGLLYEPNEEIREQWKTNDLVILQSNPVAVENEDVFKAIKKKRTMAVMYENKRENYLCKHNNIKYKGLGVEAYIDVLDLKKCRMNERELEEFEWEGKEVYIGLDLSESNDNTSVTMICLEDDVIYAKSFCFIPSEAVEEKSAKEKVDYKQYIEKGWCYDCGDRSIDYSYIEEFIMNLPDVYGVNIEQIGYDKWNCKSTAKKLENEGYETVKVEQHSKILHAPTKLLKEHILSKKFRYDGNELYEINFQNAKVTEDTNRNKYVNKKKSKEKVDMVVSTIIAMYLLDQEMFSGGNWAVQVV